MLRLPTLTLLLLTAVPGFGQMAARTLPLLDGLPTGLAVIPDFDGDGRPDLVLGSPDYSPNWSMFSRGRIRFQSSATGLSGGEITGSQNYAKFGAHVIQLGDVNGDGVPDFAFSQDSPVRLHIFSGASRTHLRSDSFPSVLSCVAATSDLDQDGVPDYVVGMRSYIANGTARVMFVSGATGAVRLEITAPTGHSSLGAAVAEVDDLDGDGVPDFALGLPTVGQGGLNWVGQVNLVSGATGSLIRALIPLTPQSYYQYGSALAVPGDINGDGVRDLVICGTSRFVAVSGATGSLLYARTLLPVALWDTEVRAARVGDLNFDGLDELLVWGRSFSDQPGATSQLVYKIVDGATGDISVPFSISESFGSYNQSWLGAGDIDGDGRPELVAPYMVNPARLFILSFPLTLGVCEGLPNSTGSAGALAITGSVSLGASTARLEATGLPALATTFFLASRTFGAATPVQGSQGALCLTGPIGRFVGPGQVQTSDAAGRASLALDPAALPTPTGLTSATVGERWSFQAWHRDSTLGGAATSNFTGARLAWIQP